MKKNKKITNYNNKLIIKINKYQRLDKKVLN